MKKTWSDFAKSPVYQNLSDEEKQQAQQRYYEKYVYPSVAGTEESESAREKFFREANPTITDKALDLGAKAVSSVTDYAKRGVSALSGAVSESNTPINFDPTAVAMQRQIDKSRSVVSGMDGAPAQPNQAAAESYARTIESNTQPKLDKDIVADQNRIIVDDFQQRGWVDDEGKTTSTGLIAKTIAERGVGLGQSMQFTGADSLSDAELDNKENIAGLLEKRKRNDETLGTAAYELLHGDKQKAYDYMRENAAAGAVDALISTAGIFFKPLRTPTIVTQGMSEAGNAYRQSVEDGMSEEAAIGRAAFQGITASLTEIVGFAGADFLLGKLAKMAPKAQASLFKKAMASVTKAGATAAAVSFDEGGEEVFNSIANDLADKYGFSKLDMKEQAQQRLANPQILDNASESFIGGALGGAMTSPVAGAGSIAQDVATLKTEEAINYTLNTDRYKLLDDTEITQMRDAASQVNTQKPGAVDLPKIEAEIARRQSLGTLERASEAGQREALKTQEAAINTPPVVSQPIIEPDSAVDAAELYGADPTNQDAVFTQGESNVSNVPSDATTGLAEQSVESAGDNVQGSLGNIPNQLPGWSNTGRVDNTTGTPAPPSNSDQSVINARTGNDAVTRPFESATDAYLQQMRTMTNDSTILKQIDDEILLRNGSTAVMPAQQNQSVNENTLALNEEISASRTVAEAKKALTKAQISGNKEAVKAAKAKISELEKGTQDSAPIQDGVIARVGVTPKAAEPVTIRNGVIYVGNEPALNFETGEDVTVQGNTFDDVKKALSNAGVLSSRQKVFSVNKQSDQPAPNNAEQAPNIETPKAQKPKATKPYKPKSLLSTMKELGGIALSEKQDVTGEKTRFAPGGYNQIFKSASTRSLKGLIESGDLDDYLPYNMRLSASTMNDDAYDSTEAYDYLADRIRNGEQILPYEVEEEARNNQLYQEQDATADADVELAADLLTEDEINEQLKIAGNAEREAAAEARIPVTESEDGDTGSSTGTQESAETNSSRQTQVTNDFALSGQTNEDINAGIAAQEAAAKAEREQAKADEEARIEAERKARQEIAADSFDLTPTGKTAKETKANDTKQIDNQFAGQGDLLAAPQTETPATELITEDGLTITSPLYVGLAENGYKMLRLDDANTYTDKGGKAHRTFEKDGVRIALDAQNVLFLHHEFPNRKPIIGRGQNDDVILSFIGVDKAQRNQGKAAEALKLIAKIADEKGLTVYLEPAQLDDTGLDKEKLVKLYAKHGFVGKGENNSVMVRKPNAIKNTDNKSNVEQDKTLVINNVTNGNQIREWFENKFGKNNIDYKKSPISFTEVILKNGDTYLFSNQSEWESSDAPAIYRLENKKSEVTKAAKALTEAGVTGKERLDTIKDVRQGNLTADEVVEAYADNQQTELAQAATITDFGEKLEGAKKDLWQNYKKAMTDELPDDLSQVTLAKYYPEPDYDNLIASGLEIKAIAAIKAMRDEVPAKPRMSAKVRRWAANLDMLRQFASGIIDGTYDIDQVFSMMREKGSLSGFVDRIELYAELGYPAMKSAKGYSVSTGWTDLRGDGRTVSLESPNGRREFYRSREDAVEALRNKLESAPEGTERKTKLDVYKVTRTGEVMIGKKVASNKYIDLKGGFKTGKEAFQYYAENEAQLLELLEQRKTLKPERRSTNNPRVGIDYRLGEDVTPEKFAAEFGFRGVQFGNYVEQSRRARDLNNAYDALLDLANIIGVPPRAISLNGTLGLAFGARGSGGKNAAAAHYERDQVVINLTKVNGFGSLGHEWFHALDNYFSKMRGENEYLTQKPTQKRIYQPSAGFADDTSIRQEVLDAFKNLMDGIRQSPYYTRSAQRDNTRTKDYWSTNEELAARAFEAYLIAKSKEAGRENDYLANIEDEDVYEIANQAARDFGGFEDPYPYPTKEEQKTFNPLFDALFATLQSKETETGGIAIYQDKAQYDVYETDLFGNPIQTRSARSGAGKVAPNASANQVSEAGIQDTEAPNAEYFVNTIVGTEQNKTLGAAVINSSKQLAQATRYLNKAAVEKLDGVITDINGKPLAVIGGFKGAPTQAAVYPATLVAEAVRVPGAANLWLSHNHPSGEATLSNADKTLYQNLKNVFDGSGISVKSLIAVTKNEYASIDDEGEQALLNIPEAKSFSTVPVIERELQDNGARGGLISSPSIAKVIGKEFYEKAQENGMILSDSQNRIVGWVPLSDKLIGNLKNTGGLNSLYRAISQSNAVGAFIVHNGDLSQPKFENGQSVVENIGRALKNIDVSLLDAINVTDNTTAAEKGDGIIGDVLFSRGQPRTPFVAQQDENYLPTLNKVIALFKSGNQQKIRDAGKTPVPISRTPVVLRQVIEDDGSKPFKRSDFVVGQGSTLYLKADNVHSRSIHSGRISKDVLDKLPDLLADPIAVFKSSPASEDGKSFKVLLDATDENGDPVIVAIKPNVPMQQLNNAPVNFQATIFPATWNKVREWNKDGLLRYYNEKSPQTSRPANNPLGTVSELSENTREGLEASQTSVVPSNPGEAATEVGARESFDANIGVSAAKVKVVTKGDIENMPEAAFSRSDAPISGMPTNSVQSVVDALRKNWTAAPEIIVVESMQDSRIPQAVRAENDRQLSQGATGEPEGFYYKGSVYVISSQMNSAKDIERVVLHETLGHFGLRKTFGKELESILKQLAVARTKDVKDKAASYGLNPAKESDRLIAAEEVLAEMAQNNPQAGFVKRAIAAVRNWLRKHGFNLQLTDNDIVVNYLLPARAYVERGGESDVVRALIPAMSRVKSLPDGITIVRTPFSGGNYNSAAVEAYINGKRIGRASIYEDKDGYELVTIDVNKDYRRKGIATALIKEAQDYVDGNLFTKIHTADGKKLFASLGMKKPSVIPSFSRAYQTNTPQFKAWFGDSKVVDADGKPLVVYHGTGESFSEFKETRNGLYFFSTEQNFAEAFAISSASNIDYSENEQAAGANIMPAYLQINKPWDYRNPDDVKVLLDALPEGFKNDEEFMSALEAGDWTVIEENDIALPLLKRNGYDGIIVTEGGNTLNYAVFEPTQIKSAIGNNGDFDPANPDIRFSRGNPQQKPIKQGGLLDRALQIPGKVVAEKITKPAYTAAARLIDSKYLLGSKAGSIIKAGIVADYGLDSQYLERRDEIEARMNQHLRKGKALIQKLGGLSREESRVAYQWLQEKPDTEAEQELMDALPSDSRQYLESIKSMIDDMSQEAISLGQLTPEQYERNKYAYLHRSYAKHEFTDEAIENKIAQLERLAGTVTDEAERKRLQAEIGNLKLNRKRNVQSSTSRKILGDQYRGRGLQFLVDPDRLDSGGDNNPIEKGQKYIRLERRNDEGILTKRVWWNSSVPVPPIYADMEQDPEAWEVRGSKDGKVLIWRDFTKAERERMGELDEAKFAVASTISKMAHDIELGKFFEFVSNDYAQDEPPEDAVVVDNAGESAWTKGNLVDALAEGAWVKVPDTKVPTTQVAKYGALAGKYVPGAVWNDIRQIANPPSIWRWYASLQRYWKIAKTALSPAVHLNNVMANFMMADMHDVRASHIVKAIETMWKANGNAEMKAFIERFEDSGAIAGTFVHAELKDDMMKPLLEELRREMIDAQSPSDQMHTVASAIAIMFGQREIRKGMNMLTHTTPGKWAKKLPEVMIETYQNEDVLFRLAAFIKAVEEGKTDREAGTLARKAFLDYRINAPWIQGLRQTVLPFVAFTYRMIPMYVETVRDKPWKLAKYMIVANALASIGMALAGIGDDEDEEIQKLLPDDRKGMTPFLVERQIPVGRTDDGRPVYLDITRWMPLGDIFEIRGDASNTLPIPGFMYPSGVMILASEALSNRSLFSGRDIWQSTDTNAEMSSKLFEHIYKGMAPNIPVLPNTYSWDKISSAISGKTDMRGRQYDMWQATASSFGIKVNTYDVDMLRWQAGMDAQNKIQEIRANINRASREYGRKGMTEEQRNKLIDSERQKLLKVGEEYQEKLQ